MEKIACPFVYANGKRCTGHIARIEGYKADLEWSLGADGQWSFSISRLRSHWHLFCSEKGNHAGTKRADDSRMKFYYDQLPPEIQAIIAGAA